MDDPVQRPLPAVTSTNAADPSEQGVKQNKGTIWPAPAWLRWLSLPSALLGIVTFFLPWVYISCGSIKGDITGHEFATGAWEEKIGVAKARKLKDRLQLDRARRLISADRPGDKGQTMLNPEQPLLWIIPVAMAVAAILITLRLPRWIPLSVVAVVACALGYFKYRLELEVANARVPGQIVLRWLEAYWISWAAVALLAVICVLAPARSRGQSNPLPPALP